MSDACRIVPAEGGDKTVLVLAEAMPKVGPLREKLPNLAERYPDVLTAPQPPRVLGTRSTARDLIDRTPEPPRLIDFGGIEVASPPFVSELRIAWPTAEATNMNRDVREVWALVGRAA